MILLLIIIIFFLRFSECEAALMGSSFPKNKSCEEVSSDFGDSAPFALQLLGKLCRWALSCLSTQFEKFENEKFEMPVNRFVLFV